MKPIQGTITDPALDHLWSKHAPPATRPDEREALRDRVSAARSCELRAHDLLLVDGRLCSVVYADEVEPFWSIRWVDAITGDSLGPARFFGRNVEHLRVLLGPGERVWAGEIHYSADWL